MTLSMTCCWCGNEFEGDWEAMQESGQYLVNVTRDEGDEREPVCKLCFQHLEDLRRSFERPSRNGNGGT